MAIPIKILLVDDHALVRDSLSRLLDADDVINVIGAVSDASEALIIFNNLQPDIVLMDIDMPGLSSFEAANRMTSLIPETKFIFLSAFFHDRYIEQALKVQAKGYLTKSEPPANLINAIKQVADGKVYFSSDVRSRIVADSQGVRLANSNKRTRTDTLSNREIEVLRYLARGMQKKEIASIMHISVKTVEGHVEKVMNKLDIHDRVELARFAIREGLAEP